MAWARAHWKSIAISMVLFFVGAGIGASGSTTETLTETTTETVTETETETETVVNTKTVKVKPAGPSGSFEGDGTFLVGSDITPGLYRAASASSGNCYWARLRDLDGELNSIVANGNTSGPALVQVASTDYAVETSGCETFRQVK